MFVIFLAQFLQLSPKTLTLCVFAAFLHLQDTRIYFCTLPHSDLKLAKAYWHSVLCRSQIFTSVCCMQNPIFTSQHANKNLPTPICNKSAHNLKLQNMCNSTQNLRSLNPPICKEGQKAREKNKQKHTHTHIKDALEEGPVSW